MFATALAMRSIELLCRLGLICVPTRCIFYSAFRFALTKEQKIKCHRATEALIYMLSKMSGFMDLNPFAMQKNYQNATN